MKKIGILTFHRAINYGAFLQCLALVRLIQSLFPSYKVEVIDYESRTEFILKFKFIFRVKGLKSLFEKFITVLRFHNDVSNYLPLSRKHLVSDKPNAISCFNNEYDAIIVGSDAVWNGVYGYKKNFFLQGISNCLKFSYAASSSGAIFNLLDEEDFSFLRKTLKDFKYIGVREDKVEHFIESIDKRLCKYHNCDPTCFLDLERLHDISKAKFQKYGISFDKPIICLMTKNETVGKYVYDEYHNSHQIVSVYTRNKHSDIFLYDLSPIEFAKFFSYVDILFSYYFHGIYLCLRNGTPAIAVDEVVESDNESTKIKYLYDRLGLNDWYFRPKEMMETNYNAMIKKSREILENSQTEKIERAIALERESSESFILSILSALNNE